MFFEKKKIHFIFLPLNPDADADAGSPVYESINFDRDLPTRPTADKPPTRIPVPKLRRQNAVGQQQEPSEPDENQKRGKCSASFLDGMIPPPPPSPPTTNPPNDDDTDNDDDLTRFGAATMEKLNKLYAMRNFLRSSNESDATEPSDFDEVTYRIRDFKDFSRRSQRGSSKPMCSLASVSILKIADVRTTNVCHHVEFFFSISHFFPRAQDVEADYLPNEDEAEQMEIKEIQLRPKTDENANTSADQRSIARCATYTRDVRSAVFI